MRNTKELRKRKEKEKDEYMQEIVRMEARGMCTGQH